LSEFCSLTLVKVLSDPKSTPVMAMVPFKTGLAFVGVKLVTVTALELYTNWSTGKEVPVKLL
jgi:hypothetical protein